MTNENVVDTQLLSRALDGDAEAFGDLYERYLDAIYHYVFYRVNSRQEAEDLTEDIFVRAWQALDSNPPRSTRFKAWIYRIAHNAVIDFYRKRKQQVALDAIVEVADRGERLETLFARREQTAALTAALNQLNPDQQEVLACRFVAGFSHAETAEIMNRREDAVRALQYRAIKALRKRLNQAENSYE